MPSTVAQTKSNWYFKKKQSAINEFFSPLHSFVSARIANSFCVNSAAKCMRIWKTKNASSFQQSKALHVKFFLVAQQYSKPDAFKCILLSWDPHRVVGLVFQVWKFYGQPESWMFHFFCSGSPLGGLARILSDFTRF